MRGRTEYQRASGLILSSQASAGMVSASQALRGLAAKCKLINMHELINKSTNNYATLLPLENSVNLKNKG